MEAALQKNATTRDIRITIIRAVNMYEAREKIDAYLPEAISTDMGYPSRKGSPVEMDAGARLVRHLLKQRKIAYLIYSGSELPKVKEFLAKFGIMEFPDILHKSYASGHRKWAQHTIDLLLKHT